MHKPWLSSQRHGFLPTRRKTLAFIGMAILMLGSCVIWGSSQLFYAEEGQWGRVLIGGFALMGSVVLGTALFTLRYIRYRRELTKMIASHGQYLNQTVLLNRHGVRWSQSGEPQRFYPWWQVGLRWRRKHVELHLLLSGVVVAIERRDLREVQCDQIRMWTKNPYRPNLRCWRCGYDLRGSMGPTCPECGSTIARGNLDAMSNDGERDAA